MYKRAEYQVIAGRMKEPRSFIQVVMDARQVGKSIVVKQVLQDLDMPYQFFSADNVPKTNGRVVSGFGLPKTAYYPPVGQNELYGKKALFVIVFIPNRSLGFLSIVWQ